MHNRSTLIFSLLFMVLTPFLCHAQEQKSAFKWPEGKKMAISLSFDDARMSQVDTGTAVLNKYGVKATFYVVPSSVQQRLDGWKKAVAAGHEIGNHSLHHPCTGNFMWSRQHALENYSLKQMREELKQTNDSIVYLLGVKPSNFAYPCGQKFIGRGTKTQSYIPVVAELFTSGRGWLDEGPNDPAWCDLAQLTGVEMDGKDFDQILALINNAKENGSWLLLAGHEIGADGVQTTRIAMLEKLLAYVNDPQNGIYIAPVSTIAKYIIQHRK